MAFPSLSSFFKGKGSGEKKPEPAAPEMLECPHCGRFFPKRGHAHEPYCRDCWKLLESVKTT